MRRFLDRSDLHHAGVDHDLDAFDHVDGQAAAVTQLDTGIDERVNHQAAGERLVAVFKMSHPPPVKAASLRVGLTAFSQPNFAFKTGSEAVSRLAGKESRGQPVLGGAPGVEALGHGAEHGDQSDRLRCGEAQRPRHLLLVEAEQFPARRGAAEYAGGAGDVPARFIMGRDDGFADPAFGLDAHHQRRDEILARHRLAIRRAPAARARPGRPDECRFRVGVVEVEHVGRDAVYQCAR